jgi:hypothetical protein
MTSIPLSDSYSTRTVLMISYGDGRSFRLSVAVLAGDLAGTAFAGTTGPNGDRSGTDGAVFAGAA